MQLRKYWEEQINSEVGENSPLLIATFHCHPSCIIIIINIINIIMSCCCAQLSHTKQIASKTLVSKSRFLGSNWSSILWGEPFGRFRISDSSTFHIWFHCSALSLSWISALYVLPCFRFQRNLTQFLPCPHPILLQISMTMRGKEVPSLEGQSQMWELAEEARDHRLGSSCLAHRFHN